MQSDTGRGDFPEDEPAPSSQLGPPTLGEFHLTHVWTPRGREVEVFRLPWDGPPRRFRTFEHAEVPRPDSAVWDYHPDTSEPLTYTPALRANDKELWRLWGEWEGWSKVKGGFKEEVGARGQRRLDFMSEVESRFAEWYHVHGFNSPSKGSAATDTKLAAILTVVSEPSADRIRSNAELFRSAAAESGIMYRGDEANSYAKHLKVALKQQMNVEMPRDVQGWRDLLAGWERG